MTTEFKRLAGFLDAIRKRTDFKPKIALVLGSGLGDFVDNLDIVDTVNYSDIAGFPISTAPSHVGRFVFANIKGVPSVVMQGRLHYYEGYDMCDVVAPIRLLKMLGAEILFLTNAAGSVDLSFEVGDFMIIKDHISCLLPSPLRGPNIAELGSRFSDMTTVYDAYLQDIIAAVAAKHQISCKSGVYLQTAGPNFETPTEIAAYRLWGASAVGMSTACEAMTANHMNMKICGISCITNLGAGIAGKPLSEAEVAETTARVADQFKTLIAESIEQMGAM